MEKLNVIDEEFQVPKKFYKHKKGFIITQHRVKQMFKGKNIQMWFRNKPEKPYIEKQYIEFKQIGGITERYELNHITSGKLLNFLGFCPSGS